MKKRILIAITLCLMLSGCEKMALMMTPAKKAQPSHTNLSITARTHFWNTLHEGRYNDIPDTAYLFTAAYLQNPDDPELAAYLGFSHIWKITERNRMKTVPPTIVNEILLAKDYFAEAKKLNPIDARIQGFYFDSVLISGTIFHDEREQVKGYFGLTRAIKAWPEFNYFTAGYPMSNLSFHSPHFKEGLDWQWRTLSLCADKQITARNPDFKPYLHLETHIGPKRACWNSWIAPHNFEGFFLNMGDMLVKQGDWKTAIQIYHNATLSQTFNTWPYRSMLIKRIKNAKRNVAYFKKENGHSADTRILFNSGYGCVVCHQAK